MEKEVNLKAKNTPKLWIFLASNILIHWSIILPNYFKEIMNYFDTIIVLKCFSASIAPLLLFLLNGLLSSNQKAILVFWKLQNPLPGSEAFSNLNKSDSRINMKRLKEIYGPLPKKSLDQNILWYKIYKKNALNIVVSESHQAFLLARDLTSLCFLLLIFIGLPSLVFGIWPINMYYFCYLLSQYAIVVIVAQNKGRRLVTNVLAIESI